MHPVLVILVVAALVAAIMYAARWHIRQAFRCPHCGSTESYQHVQWRNWRKCAKCGKEFS
ncbi:transposase [Candidatus Parcubacteria bacterium]|nr:transposase [Candidatus Parcubacteria bacterium]